MKTYLLIANKPDSADYCMGCQMESYSGDYIIEHNLTEEALIERIAELESKPLGRGESGYDITFTEEPPEIEFEVEDRIRSGIAIRTKQRIAEREAAAQAKAEAKKAAEKAQAEAAERKQLQQLTAKYGEVKP